MKVYIILAALPVLLVSVLALSFVSAHGWFGMSKGDGAEHKGMMFEQKAEFLGMSVEEMKDMWTEGKNFHEMKEESGFVKGEFKMHMKEGMEERMAEHLQSLVDDGVITQEQADEKSQIMGEHGMFKKGFYHGFGK